MSSCIEPASGTSFGVTGTAGGYLVGSTVGAVSSATDSPDVMDSLLLETAVAASPVSLLVGSSFAPHADITRAAIRAIASQVRCVFARSLFVKMHLLVHCD